MQEHILLSVRQHVSKYLFRLPRWLGIGAVAGNVVFFLSGNSSAFGIGTVISTIALGFFLEWRRFVKSRLVITNLRVYLSVMK